MHFYTHGADTTQFIECSFVQLRSHLSHSKSRSATIKVLQKKNKSGQAFRNKISIHYYRFLLFYISFPETWAELSHCQNLLQVISIHMFPVRAQIKAEKK